MSWRINLAAAKQKIEEAKRVSKCPWCCDSYVEWYVYGRMNPNWMFGKEPYPQETFEESQRRWLKEGIIKKLPDIMSS